MSRLTPRDAYALSRTLVGLEVNGDTEALPEAIRRFTTIYQELPDEVRGLAWEAFLAAREDRDELVKAVTDAVPEGPPPEADEILVRPASLADLQEQTDDSRWLWKGYIPSGQLSGIAAFEGVGKTRFAIDLARRIYRNSLWPDGQPPTFPKGTPTLWVCSDGQQDEVKATAKAFGMPDEAIYFNTPRDDPYGGTTLDQDEVRERLESFIGVVKPGLVFIDSLTYATSDDMNTAKDTKSMMTPLRDLAQRTGTTIVSLLHLSKEGQPLGRRIKGITRTILQLDCPNPEQSSRLKLWVPKSFAMKPAALGVTMGESGNEYDLSPPTTPEPSRGGRPSVARDKAIQFIRVELTRQNDQTWNELRDKWTKGGENAKRFQDAVKALESDGELVKDGGKGTGKQLVIHLVPPEDETQNP